MAKYTKTSKAVLGGLISVIAVGAIVGVIGVASKGFDGDVMADWFTKKEDYANINLVNKYEDKALTQSTALDFLNYDYKITESVELTTNLTLDSGGMVFDGTTSAGILKTTFKEGITYTNIAITGHQYYEKDDQDEETLHYFCDSSKISVNGLDPVSYVTNESNNTKAPKTETKKFKFDEAQTGLNLSVTNGKFVITSIELWNVKTNNTDKTTTSSSEATTSSSEA